MIRTPANLGGGLPASVLSGIETALGWPGGCDSVDFGPGTTSPKGNVGPPSGFPGLPSSLFLTPPQLLMLNLEGVAGSGPGRGGPREHIWTWVVARLRCLDSASLQLPPQGLWEAPSLCPFGFENVWGPEQTVLCPGGLGKVGDRRGQAGRRTIGRGWPEGKEHLVVLLPPLLLLPPGVFSLGMGEGIRIVKRSSFLGTLCRNPEMGCVA